MSEPVSASSSSGAKFYPKKAHFEKKSQCLPNQVIFDRNLSDAAKILITALNGIISTSPGWVPVQSDLERRLNFGPKKMRGAIKSAIKNGYLRIRQKRKVTGKYSQNEFEFDIYGEFEKEIEELKEFVPHDPKGNTVDAEELHPQSSWTERPSRRAVKEQLPCSEVKPCLREQQQQKEDVVVVFSDAENENREALKPFDVPTTLLKHWIRKPVQEIRDAIESFHQYAEGREIDNPIGLLVKMINIKAKPNILKKKSDEYKKQEENILIEKNKLAAQAFDAKCKEIYNDSCSMKIYSDCVEIKFTQGKKKFCTRIGFREIEMVKEMNSLFKEFYKKDV